VKLLHVTPKGAKVEELEDDEEEAAGTIPEGLSETTPEQVESLIKTYEDSKQYKNVTKHIQKSNEKPNSGPLKNNAVAAGIMLQFAMLLGRAFKNIAREPMLLRVRFMQALTIGILGGLMYLRIKGDQSGVQDRVSALFFILTSASFGGFNGPTFIFPSERGVFFRERSANLYSTGVYYISKLLAELPVMTIIPMIQTTIAYFMIGFNDSVGSFLTYGCIFYQFALLTLLFAVPWILTCVSMLLLSNVAFAMGMLLSCAILDTSIVIKIQPLILLPFMLFSGFFLNAASVPVYFIWLEHISFLKYAYRIACNAVFPGLTFTCEAGSICRDRTGEDVLKRLAFDSHPVWLDVVALAVMVVGYNLLAFLFLALRRKH
jgi:ABC-type multidrug transport system permease subunit